MKNQKPFYIEGDDLNADWIKKANPKAQAEDIAAGEDALRLHQAEIKPQQQAKPRPKSKGGKNGRQ